MGLWDGGAVRAMRTNSTRLEQVVYGIFSALLFSLARASPDFVNRWPHLKTAPDFNEVGWKDTSPHIIGNITSFVQSSPAAFNITCGVDRVRVVFFRKEVVRIWVGWGGEFTDDASADLVVGAPASDLQSSFTDLGDHYEMRAGRGTGIALRAAKQPLRFSMHLGGVQLWTESVGLSQNATSSFQTLATAEEEFFFGGGMQNGRFSHRGYRIRISTDYNWADGGNPNAVPFFLSTAGYGIYRNTWSPGYYDFSRPPLVLAHNESRFDSFYFAASPRDFKSLLESYTFVTGRPFMPPAYGLGLGDSDCYHNNRHGNDTRVVTAVAQKYRELDMPGSWFLPNDGYGCGFGVGPTSFPSNFTTLDHVAATLKTKHGFEMGLWSSTGLPNISREVSGSGVRIFKTDVGWIGAGYRYAFDAVRSCVEGIEGNSDARRFIWTVEGWAGTHRLAVMWTGDNSGSFDYLRWQIPTFVGAGFSAQAHVSGDVDGIFGGSPETYVRDLQFKCMMTTVMSMSGWAANPDKQPWTWGEPYTSINRAYLKLKARLTPYFYTLSRNAYDTGVPPVRAMALEFPNDWTTFSSHVGSAQQFMAGPWLLVAPVYRPLAEARVRDGIYLPSGDWVDYWDGRITTGPTSVNGYPAPLEKLPLFVRAGAILPLGPATLYPGHLSSGPLTLEVYPSGESTFELYEDDGVTRQALEGNSFAVTNMSCLAPVGALHQGGRVTLVVGASVGSYIGKPSARAYDIRFHMSIPPKTVLLHTRSASKALPLQQSLSQLEFVQSGWFFNPVLLGGIVHVKTSPLATSHGFEIVLSSGFQYPRIAMKQCAHPVGGSQAFDFGKEQGYPHRTGRISLRTSSDSCLTVADDNDIPSQTPALEIQPCAATLSKQQVWTLDVVTHNLHLHGDTHKCVDVDRSNHTADTYSCYRPIIANQQFVYYKVTGALTTMLDGSCMTVVKPPLFSEHTAGRLDLLV